MFKYNLLVIKFILLIAACSISFLSIAQETVSFIHLSADVDRQQTNATSIAEDSIGYLWLNSSLGILRYDGYDYRLYKAEAIFGNDHINASILDIKKDSKGGIWCVSKKGAISKLLSNGKFVLQFSTHVSSVPNQTFESFCIGTKRIWLGSNTGTILGKSLNDSTILEFNIHSPNETITSIVEGRKGTIWFGTNKGRIFKGNISTQEINELRGPFNNPYNIISLTTDNLGKLWIATELYGLFAYDENNGNFEQFHNKAKGIHFVPANLIIRIFHDSRGFIWAGTDGGGLYRINPKTKETIVYNHSKTDKFSLQSNTILGIGETNNKDIWVFTNYGNINILPNESSIMGYYSGSISNTPTRVLSIMRTQKGYLWVGTDGDGLTVLDKAGKAINQYIPGTSSSRGLTGSYIQAMAEDKNQNKWIGSYHNGLLFYNSQTDRFTPIKITNDKNQPAIDIRSLLIDSKNRLWIGSNIGISVYSIAGNEIAFFPHNKNGLKGSIAEVFIEDEFGQIWIGMYEGGVSFLEEDRILSNSRFTTYKLSESDRRGENSVNYGIADLNGYLYLINSNSKLCKFSLEMKKTVPIEGFSQDKLSGIKAIQLSDSANLWGTRNNSISHFDLTNFQDHFYSRKNGTIKGNYLSGSAAKDQNGLIFFGGVGGLNYIDPLKMKTTYGKLNLYINKIKIANRNAEELIPEQLSKGIEHISSLQLNHKQNRFSFQFSIINDHLDPNYYYLYRLKGHDTHWVTTINERTANYTDIPYGNYIFEVKAGTRYNIWDIEGKSIKIKILPPFWRTWWAYSIYASIFLIISFYIIRYYIMWARLKQKLLMEELQNEKNKELYDMKMNFFAKMSHEIQTPLTLILSPIDSMIEKAEGNMLLSQRLQVIKNNANRLSRIALELMTIRNKELGKLTIKASNNNIAKDIDNIALSFMEQARFKNIDFTIEGTKGRDIMLWYDKDKLEHILYNLLANSFKFTPREGKIILCVEEDKIQNKIFIKVTDSGIGIPKEDLSNIFNLFYQSKDGKLIGGTGIGLAITKELITLHKGTIEVISEENLGTTFTIGLLQGNKHFKDEEIISAQEYTPEIIENKKREMLIDAEKEMPVPDENKRNLLVVEDNFEMLMFLQESFANIYNVRVAQNGQEALDCLNDFKADIIISDVMMPIMDGIALCKSLKEKHSTRHIPIILLTTKNTTRSKLEGLRFGAIEYINKPFNVKELLFKVNNILDAQRRVIEQYRTEILTESKEMEVESPDEKFIEAVLLEMERNFEDPEFRLEELANSLNMSYSNTYRKFQALTDKTLVDFMRSFRLKKAIPLLINHSFSISEVAFQIGFNDPKYFSKCFKKKYGKTPKQYKQENSSKDNTILPLQ